MTGNVRQIKTPTLATRKLTGKPPWPIVLLAGGEKVGKSWSAVEACMSALVAGGLWFPLGENDPDEYAQIKGFDQDRFDLVQHDGTYRGLLAQMDAALAVETADGLPLVWVLDSGSRLWDLLSGMAQREMWERLARKAAQQNRPVPDTEQKPAVDLWNTAADRWAHIMDAIRAHNGPTIITARMEMKTVMGADGAPTKDKEQKILTQKSLPFDVDAIVEMVARGETYLTGVRSVKLASLDSRVSFPKFTVHELWTRLGLDGVVGERSHSSIDPDDVPTLEADQARADLLALIAKKGWDKTEVAAEFEDRNGGLMIGDATAPEVRQFTEWREQQKAAS